MNEKKLKQILLKMIQLMGELLEEIRKDLAEKPQVKAKTIKK